MIESPSGSPIPSEIPSEHGGTVRFNRDLIRCFVAHSLRRPSKHLLATMTGSRSLRLLCVGALMLGCAKQNESPTDIPGVGLSTGKSACLNQTSKIIRSYFDGALADAEISGFFTCLNRVVMTFERYSKGRDPASFTPDEIRNFLQETQIIEGKIPDDLLQELMQFKRLLISGTAMKLGRSEFERIYTLLNLFKNIAIDIRAAVPVVFHPNNQAEFKTAYDTIRQGLEPFFQLLVNNNETYSIKNLVGLVQAWAKWANLGQNSVVSFIQTYSPVIGTVKSMLIGPGPEEIYGQDWASLRNLICKGLEAYMLFQNFYVAGSWFEAKNSVVLNDMVLLGFDIAEQGIRQQPNQMWSDADVTHVLTAIQDTKILDLGFSPEILQQATSTVLHKIFKTPSDAGGFGLAQLAVMKAEWNQFYARQLELQIDPHWDSMALPVDVDGRWVMDADHASHWDLRSASLYHVKRALIDRVMRSYATRTSAQEPLALQPDDVTALAQDFSLLIADITGSTPEKFAKRIIQEANVFLPASDGLKPINLAEGTEYLHSLLTGFAAGKIAQASITNFADLPPAKTLSHLPGLVGRLTSQDWKTLGPLLESAVRGSATGPLTTGNYVSIWVMLQYVEVFMARFDADQSTTINKVESLEAYKIYGPTLSGLIQSYNLSSDEERALYTFLFRYGETPTDSFTGSLKFLMWKWNEETWSFEANRVRLTQILSRLSTL